MTKFHKYRAKKTKVDGIEFASKREAARYVQLKELQDAGEIRNLELQPRFTLLEGFRYLGAAVRKVEYVADFRYFDVLLSDVVVEDTKGFRTPDYRLKRKLFLWKYPNLIFFET